MNPYGTSPVVLALSKILALSTQTAQTERRPEMLRISDEVENGTEMGRVWLEKAKEEGEERDVAFVADVDRVI